MVRRLRPSDVLPRPQAPPQPPPPVDPQRPEAGTGALPTTPPARGRRWLLVVAGVLACLAAATLTRGSVVVTERTVPVVARVDPEHAALALEVFRAEAEVAEALRQHNARPGADERVRTVAAEGAVSVTAALERARAAGRPDPLADAYWHDPGHRRLVVDLERAAADPATLTAPVAPAATERLRAYLQGLPPELLAELRGSPDTGPALRRLDQEQRTVSEGQ